MMKKVLFTTVIALLGFATLALAAPRGAGYVDLDRLVDGDVSATVDIHLGGWILGLAKSAANEADDEDLAFLKRLDSVQVKVFETPDNARRTADRADRLVDELQDEGWERVVTATDDDGFVYVMVHGSADRLDGLMVVALEDDETVFVNVVGRLEPDDIAWLLDGNLSDDIDFDLDFDV